MASSMVFASITFFALVSSVLSCGFPSNQWCSDEQIAKKCGVYKQCLVNDWAIQEAAAKNVSVVLCFESMCPDCQDFFGTYLYPTFKKIGSIMDIKIIPYGNAGEHKDGDHWEFRCQHGTEECIGNMIETCGGYYLNTTESYLPWMKCVETSGILPREAAVKCAKKFPYVPIDKIMACSKSSLGNQLEHEMALATDKLCPNHQYVPWVMINGEYSKEAEKHLLKVVCEAYKGPKPPACKEA